MLSDPVFIVVAVLAVLLIGVSKSGFGGAMGSLSVPLLSLLIATPRAAAIMLPIMLGADQTARPMIVTDQIQSGRGKQKACGLFATFCPFCGVSYQQEQPA